jgi:predicted dehydrogenase
MDALVLANYFHEHAPLAIQAMNAGLHVMSECAACHTLAEGVALARTVEKTGRIYMFAENYPYMLYNQEMRRLYRKGVVGEFKYGECEYVHPDPAEVKLARSCGRNHWRNWIPSTYYCTHSIAPVMYITDTRPVSVNSLVIPHDFDDPTIRLAAKRFDTAAVIFLRMDNDAVLKSLHGALRGHGNYTRIHGNKGLMESCRHGLQGRVRLWRDAWDKRKGEPTETVYRPDFPHHHKEASRTGHGGGDFFTNYDFAQAIRTGQQPYLDVYRGIDMSIAGVQAWRSALAGGAPVEVPDFRKESVRRKYVNDHWSPDPTRKRAKKDIAPNSILGRIDQTPEALALAKKVWAKQGYTGD